MSKRSTANIGGGSLTALARFVKHRPIAALVIGAGLLVLGFMTFNQKGLITRIKLEQKHAAIEEAIKKAEEENERLREQIRKIQTDKAEVERIAREKYGMAKKGETIYKVVPKKKESDE